MLSVIQKLDKKSFRFIKSSSFTQMQMQQIIFTIIVIDAYIIDTVIHVIKKLQDKKTKDVLYILMRNILLDEKQIVITKSLLD